jgi:hypothetical protein
MGKNEQKADVGPYWDQANPDQKVQMLCRALSNKKMDKNKLQRLIDAADDQDQLTLKILYNAVVANLTAYNSQKTSARLKDWKNAESALLKSIADLEAKYFPTDRPLPNLLAVVEWFKDRGWKTGKSKVYADAKAGRLRPEKDGTYAIKAVQKYAAAYLRQLGSAGRRDASTLDDLAETKARSEAEILASKALIFKSKADAASGLYVLRDEFDKALAQRAAIFKADLEGFCRGRASEIINLVSGDAVRIPDLIEYMLSRMEEVLARYSEDKPIDVPALVATPDGDLEDYGADGLNEEEEDGKQ